MRIGNAHYAQHDFAEALKSYTEALATADRLLKLDPGNAGWAFNLALCYGKVFAADFGLNELDAALDALQRQLKASLRERAKIPSYDQTKWMTVNSSIYSTWNPTGPFRGVVTATDGGSCALGHREFLALTP